MERAELKAVIRATGVAVERNGAVFLCAPDWSMHERLQAEERMTAASETGCYTGAGWLCIRTGGSGGMVKFARHDEITLGAAAEGFATHFGLNRVNAVGVLPPAHISGLMTRVRCQVTGGEYVDWEWKRLEAGDCPSINGDHWVISLVPTQLQRLLTRPAAVEWLRRFRIILVGGGPAWPQLADAAAAAALRVSLSYGMTETAAMVTALRPEEFLAGARDCGASLPHVQVTIAPDGMVKVAGASMFHGYWPQWSEAREFVTEDLGAIDSRGHLEIKGRRDAMIITGGKKVQPADVEAALRASGEFVDVAVFGLPDAEWGEAVVACYPVGPAKSPDLARAVAQLAPHQRPKRFVAIAEWPRTAQGKINRETLRAAVIACP